MTPCGRDSARPQGRQPIFTRRWIMDTLLTYVVTPFALVVFWFGLLRYLNPE